MFRTRTLHYRTPVQCNILASFYLGLEKTNTIKKALTPARRHFKAGGGGASI